MITMIVKENLVSQVKREILAYIFREGLSRGSKLPSIENLASLFSVGRSTVREAIRSLEQAHILETLQGKGTFLIADPSSLGKDISRLRSATEMARDSGIELVTLRVEKEKILADALISKKLGIPLESPLVLLKRIRGIENEPLLYLEDIIPENYTANFSDGDWHGSLFQALEQKGIVIAYSKAKIIPYCPDKDFLKKLGLKRSVPFLLLEHVHYDARGQAILFSKDYYHSEFFHFEVLRKRL
ncbi:GntR family transcriptional regulator [Atrimonas thermophila]